MKVVGQHRGHRRSSTSTTATSCAASWFSRSSRPPRGVLREPQPPCMAPDGQPAQRCSAVRVVACDGARPPRLAQPGHRALADAESRRLAPAASSASRSSAIARDPATSTANTAHKDNPTDVLSLVAAMRAPASRAPGPGLSSPEPRALKTEAFYERRAVIPGRHRHRAAAARRQARRGGPLRKLPRVARAWPHGPLSPGGGHHCTNATPDASGESLRRLEGRKGGLRERDDERGDRAAVHGAPAECPAKRNDSGPAVFSLRGRGRPTLGAIEGRLQRAGCGCPCGSSAGRERPVRSQLADSPRRHRRRPVSSRFEFLLGAPRPRRQRRCLAGAIGVTGIRTARSGSPAALIFCADRVR